MPLGKLFRKGFSNGEPKDHLGHLLLPLYTLLLPLRRLLYLPFFKAKIQLPELVFIPLLFSALPSVLAFCRREWQFLMALLVPLWLTMALSAARTGAVDSILEVVGRGYLMLVMLVFAAAVTEYREKLMPLLRRAYRGALVLIVVTAAIGYASLLFGYSSRWVLEFKGFPYLGTVYRAASSAGSPTDTVLLATLPVMWEWRHWRIGEVGGWLLAAAVPVLLLTLSKDVVVTGLGCWLVDPRFGVIGRGPRLSTRAHARGCNAEDKKQGGAARRSPAGYRAVLPLALLLLYLGWSHYLPEAPHTYSPQQLEGVHWTGGQIAWKNDVLQFTETTYVATKRAALALLADEPWFGVGPDRMEILVGDKVATGHYPANLPHFRPHSTWFGALAETGWLGFAALCGFAALLIWRFRQYGTRAVVGEDLSIVAIFLILLLAASLIVDVLHLRYVWVPIGILVGLTSRSYASRGEEG